MDMRDYCRENRADLWLPAANQTSQVSTRLVPGPILVFGKHRPIYDYCGVQVTAWNCLKMAITLIPIRCEGSLVTTVSYCAS